MASCEKVSLGHNALFCTIWTQQGRQKELKKCTVSRLKRQFDKWHLFRAPTGRGGGVNRGRNAHQDFGIRGYFVGIFAETPGQAISGLCSSKGGKKKKKTKLFAAENGPSGTRF